MATSEEIYGLLDAFVRQNPVAVEALTALRGGVSINLTIETDEGASDYHVLVQKRGGSAEKGANAKADFTMRTSTATAKKLLTSTAPSVGDFGVEVLKLAVVSDPDQKIHLRVHASTTQMLRNGYIKLAAKGGPAVASFLAHKGMTSPKKILAGISRLRGH